MEKNLITFGELKTNCIWIGHLGCNNPKNKHSCYIENCPIWQNLESPEEKITIVPAGGR